MRNLQHTLIVVALLVGSTAGALTGKWALGVRSDQPEVTAVATSTITTTTTTAPPRFDSIERAPTTTTPVPTTTTTPHSHGPSPSRPVPIAWSAEVTQAVTDAAAKWGFPLAEGMAIVQCESGGNPSAKSPTNDWGLWQHNLSNPGGDARTRFARLGYDFDLTWDDPVVNSDVAGWLWSQSGWQPWTCRRVL